jgi:hypothetical protein
MYFNSGVAHCEAKRRAEAAADFTRAPEVKGDDKASLRCRGYSYYYIKDYDRGIARYRRGTMKKPARTGKARCRPALTMPRRQQGY